jgi:hypothetical protein
MLHVAPPIYLVESAVTHVRPAVLPQRSRKTRSDQEPVERRWNLDSSTTTLLACLPLCSLPSSLQSSFSHSSPCLPAWLQRLLLPRWVSSQQLFRFIPRPFPAISVSWVDLTLPVVYVTVEVFGVSFGYFLWWSCHGFPWKKRKGNRNVQFYVASLLLG